MIADKSSADVVQPRFTKRSQSPNVGEPRDRSHSPVNSPKRLTEVGQPKQLLQGCSRRLNFQRLHHQKVSQRSRSWFEKHRQQNTSVN